MDSKFLGIGLKNAMGLWLLFILFSVMAKVAFTKYDVPGLSEIVRTGA